MFKSKIKAAFLLMPEANTEVSAAIKEALELRKSFKGAVLLEFNSVIVRIEKDSTPEAIYSDWVRRSDNKRSW